MEQIVLDRLNQLRNERGESFKQLEAAVGISDSTLSKWYSGKGEMSTYGVKRLAEHYGMSVSDLLADTPLSTVPQEKQQEMDIVLSIIAESKAKEDAHNQHFQCLLDHQMELRRLEKEKFEALKQQQEDYHEKVVSYLKKQVARFRITSIIFLALFVCGIIYNTFCAVADVPLLGAGGSVIQNGDVTLGFVRLVTVPLLILLPAAVVWLLVSNHKVRHPNKESEHS